MARWSKSDKARIELRRVHVQRLSVRGLGLYEIVDELADLEIVNPDTGKPYDPSTISRDLTELEKRCREASQAELSEHKAKQLGELREARRMAWEAGDYAEVRRNLETESNLLGTKAPQRQELSTPEGGGLTVVIRRLERD